MDSATTTSMGANKESFHSIELADDPTGTIGDVGKLDLNCTTETNNVGRMPFNKDGIANSFGMNNSIERGFCVHMDGAEENCIFAEKDNVVGKFIASDGGSCFHDLWNNDLCFEKSNDDISIENNIFVQSHGKVRGVQS